MEKRSNIHAGHRQRLDEKVRVMGLDALPQHEQLEYMLYQIIARGDTNGIAHGLLQKFGSLEQVFNASARELETVDGVGARTANFISQIPAIAGIYQRSTVGDKPILDTTEKLGEYATTLFYGKPIEEVYVICLTAKRKLTRFQRVSIGGVSSVPVYVMNLVDSIAASKPHSVVLAHNHPSGEVTPSSDDIELTKKVADALNGMNVNLLDHVIVAGKKYISMKKSGIIF